MNDLLFSANAVLPIILMVFIGWALKKIKLVNDNFLTVGNKLTFNLLLPVLLFNNVYAIQSFSQINWVFVIYGVAMVIALCLVAVPVCMAFTKDNSQRGVFIQAVFRSNYAIIGIPLATQLFGMEGAASASVLSAFSIPVFNILAVIVLSVFNGSENRAEGGKVEINKVLSGIIRNPLIIGVVFGLFCLLIRSFFLSVGVPFRLSNLNFLFTALKYIGSAATPFALIVLGGQFEFSAISRLKKPIIFGTVMRTVIVPIIALGLALLIVPDLGGGCYAAYIALFGTPVAVSSAIMAREMNCDGDLAGQLVVWTTILSSVTLFITIAIFRSIGIF